MQERKIGRVFLEIFMMAAILVVLSSLALPRVGMMFDSEPVGYTAGVDLPGCESPASDFGEFYRHSCNFIGVGIAQSVPGGWRMGFLVPFLSIDYVQQLFTGQESPEVFTE